MRSWLLTLAVLAALPIMSGKALAQIESREGIALQNQILELRRDIQSLQSSGRSSGGGSSLGGGARSAPPASGGGSDVTTALLERVSQMEEEVRRLRGQSDEMRNQMQRQSEDSKKALEDLQFRLNELEAGRGRRSDAGGAAATPARPAATAATPTAAARTPEAALREGNAALARRDYVAAEAAAREVLAARSSPRAGDAQFLLAESLYGRRQFQQAAIAYDDAYKRGRTGTRAQDSLLGLANSFIGISEKRSACDTLNQLRSEFPSPRQDLRDRIAQSRQRAGCR